ncbi:hypothetical protein Hamer_G001329 [Homarus americanus]|uniref:Uncharacterized protein n=1 Tax=Homarus americanus TaxID=6706 RepID=A0A8J5N7P8_HOMAM|nr:hypothetical protein Hamer_G001329 [Homarus americanus]
MQVATLPAVPPKRAATSPPGVPNQPDTGVNPAALDRLAALVEAQQLQAAEDRFLLQQELKLQQEQFHEAELRWQQTQAAADATRADRVTMQDLIHQALNVSSGFTPAPGLQGVDSGDSNGSITVGTSPAAATGHPRPQVRQPRALAPHKLSPNVSLGEFNLWCGAWAVTVDDVLTRIKDHLQRQHNVALRRVRFEERRQREGESFIDFYVALKELADDAVLRDQYLVARTRPNRCAPKGNINVSNTATSKIRQGPLWFTPDTGAETTAIGPYQMQQLGLTEADLSPSRDEEVFGSQ